MHEHGKTTPTNHSVGHVQVAPRPELSGVCLRDARGLHHGAIATASFWIAVCLRLDMLGAGSKAVIGRLNEAIGFDRGGWVTASSAAIRSNLFEDEEIRAMTALICASIMSVLGRHQLFRGAVLRLIWWLARTDSDGEDYIERGMSRPRTFAGMERSCSKSLKTKLRVLGFGFPVPRPIAPRRITQASSSQRRAVNRAQTK